MPPAPRATTSVPLGGTPPTAAGVSGAPGAPGAPAAAAYNYKVVLQQMVQQNASDLHLKVGRPPTIRIDGELKALDMPALRPEDLRSIGEQIIPPKQRKEFEVEIAASQ